MTNIFAIDIIVSINMTTEIHQNLVENLELIGLEEKEAAVYLACLELGPSSVWDISQKSGIKRPTCYVLLDNLVEKRVAHRVEGQKRTKYFVRAPKELLSDLERRKTRFEQNIGQFQALASKSQDKPQIRLYEGAEGIERVYESTLEEGEGAEILIYGTATVLLKYEKFMEKYLARRVNRGIRARAILPDNEINREIAKRDPDELRETRFLPQDQYDQQTEVNILLDSIIYIAHSEDEPFATVVESLRLAKEEKDRFELLWKLAE